MLRHMVDYIEVSRKHALGTIKYGVVRGTVITPVRGTHFKDYDETLLRISSDSQVQELRTKVSIPAIPGDKVTAITPLFIVSGSFRTDHYLEDISKIKNSPQNTEIVRLERAGEIIGYYLDLDQTNQLGVLTSPDERKNMSREKLEKILDETFPIYESSGTQEKLLKGISIIKRPVKP